jgi:methyl-accepting chemotaxis protein WspA
MKMSIWQRLNSWLAVLIGLLLLAGALAWWIERTRADAVSQSESLNGGSYRIHYNLFQAGDSVRSLLAEPKNDTEKKLLRDTETDLATAIKDLQTSYADQPELTDTLKNLQDYATRTRNPFHAQVLELLETDPSAALAYYMRGNPAVREKRDLLLADLRRQIRRVAERQAIHARTISLIGSVSIAVIFLSALFAAWRQSAAVTVPLNHLVAVLEQMRRGDFTRRVTLERKDEFGILGEGLNRLADDLSVLVGQVQRSGIQVNMSATEIAATARATTKQISATSRELEKTMNEVNQVAEDTTELANRGQSAIAHMETTMRLIMDASSTITTKLAVLNEKTANINSVVTTITKVADQTNLLSLNAAIEAEKAGEYGLGFAVVAMEIRRLADQTAVATYDIEKMVKEMQAAVTAGVMGMDKFSEELRQGVEEIRQVSTPLGQIIHQVQTLTPRFQLVNEGMHAQATGAQQISETLTQLSEAASQTADSLRQSNLAIDQLNEAARGLQTSVARFTLSNTGGAAGGARRGGYSAV